MILEVAPLTVIPGQEAAFEQAFAKACALIGTMPGYLGHQLQVCMEQGNQYLLLVQWQRLEDHTEGFRGSPQYQQWKALLHHFYDPFPTVRHYQGVMAQAPGQPLLYPGREQPA
ncbi:antibiotic biosynthesis monooxygenase family protein [Aeromonas molluscorum]|uniref:Antibiotic biosynthesis monooxygenase n=1 Tax=Aeromonas molluscorum 848 TaxID=1268236 RepID=R1H6T1_9GAMM|nr:antibiotic biosynthesis monooxygenase [Aeromonas molluscorum]EOD54174.1 antibiotic biosynthesis monooxygenase [Aeromonas molluscorum 848]